MSPAAPTTWKDSLDVATKIASLVLAVIAVSPALRKAHYLLTTAPTESDDIRKKRIMMTLDGRMGWVQLAWTQLLWWCRKDTDELLTWKERRARYFWCRILRHKWNPDQVQSAGSTRLHAWCRRCRADFVLKTKEGLEKCRRGGRAPYTTETTRYRDDPAEREYGDWLKKDR